MTEVGDGPCQKFRILYDTLFSLQVLTALIGIIARDKVFRIHDNGLVIMNHHSRSMQKFFSRRIGCWKKPTKHEYDIFIHYCNAFRLWGFFFFLDVDIDVKTVTSLPKEQLYII